MGVHGAKKAAKLYDCHIVSQCLGGASLADGKSGNTQDSTGRQFSTAGIMTGNGRRLVGRPLRTRPLNRTPKKRQLNMHGTMRPKVTHATRNAAHAPWICIMGASVEALLWTFSTFRPCAPGWMCGLVSSPCTACRIFISLVSSNQVVEFASLRVGCSYVSRPTDRVFSSKINIGVGQQQRAMTNGRGKSG